MQASIYNTKNNHWRESYNPLRGLNLPRVVGLLEAGERGQYADLQWFYHYMERSDPMIYAILQRRRAALLDTDWTIRQVSGAGSPGSARSAGRTAPPGRTDQVLAREQAAFLTELYDGLENFRDAITFLAFAFFRGYAHLEKHFTPDGLLQKLEPVEQWFWVRDGMFADWEYNANAVSGRRRGLPIRRENFVIFETVPMNRMLAVLYLRRTLSQKDWDSYLEVFGIPSTFLIGPPNASGAKEKSFQAIADEIISDGRGFLPNGSDIKYVTGGGAKPPFLDHIDYIDRQIAMVGTGGLLTMLAQPGSGTLAGGAHSDTFLQIARSDAAALSEVLQKDIDLPYLQLVFPGRPVLAYFEFASTQPNQSTQVVQDAATLAAAGYRLTPAELSQRTGYAVQDPSAPPQN